MNNLDSLFSDISIRDYERSRHISIDQRRRVDMTGTLHSMDSSLELNTVHQSIEHGISTKVSDRAPFDQQFVAQKLLREQASTLSDVNPMLYVRDDYAEDDFDRSSCATMPDKAVQSPIKNYLHCKDLLGSTSKILSPKD